MHTTRTIAVIVAIIFAGCGSEFDEDLDLGAPPGTPDVIDTGAGSAGSGTGNPPIDTAASPEMVTIDKQESQDGISLNASVQFAVWTNCGSYDAFLEKYRACEPAAIRMTTMGTFTMEYHVLGVQDGACRIEVDAVQFPMYEGWSGKSMVCACDPSLDFIAQTEHLNVQGVMNGTADCEGALFDAMTAKFNAGTP